jgi:hypothetical protein
MVKHTTKLSWKPLICAYHFFSRLRSTVGFTARLLPLFFTQSWPSAILQSRRYHLCLPLSQGVLLRFGLRFFVWQFRDARDRFSQAVFNSMVTVHFPSPQANAPPSSPPYGRAFATRSPTIASQPTTSRRQANSPSHQHRRYHHHHNHHQSPCQAIPPTSWAPSSCGYASAFPQPYFSNLSSAIRSLPLSPTTTASHKWYYHHRCGHSTSRRPESQ